MKAFNVTSRVLVCFSPDYKYNVSGLSDCRIWVLQVPKGEDMIELLSIKGHTKVVTSVAFSPGGKNIASESEDNTVRVWDAKMGKGTLEAIVGHSNGISSVSFTPSVKSYCVLF